MLNSATCPTLNFYDTICIIKGSVSALVLEPVVFTSGLVPRWHPRAASSSKTLRVSVKANEI